MTGRWFAKALFFIVLGSIVAWQLPSMLTSDPAAEAKRLQESCSARPEDMARWETITGSALAAMDLANVAQHLCVTGTPRREAVEAVNATLMPRRRI